MNRLNCVNALSEIYSNEDRKVKVKSKEGPRKSRFHPSGNNSEAIFLSPSLPMTSLLALP